MMLQHLRTATVGENSDVAHRKNRWQILKIQSRHFVKGNF